MPKGFRQNRYGYRTWYTPSHTYLPLWVPNQRADPDRYMFGYSGEALMNRQVQKRGQCGDRLFLCDGYGRRSRAFVNENNWRAMPSSVPGLPIRP